jgi:hypothetical protein
MKYFKIIASILAIAVFYFIYLFIPNKIVLSGNDYIPKSADELTRGIMEIQYWDRWMPYKKIEGHTFLFEKGKMEVQEAFISSAKSKYSLEDITAPITLSAVDAGKDSSFLRYECIIDNHNISPVKRVHYYLMSKEIQKELDPILLAAKKYYTQPTVKDSTHTK